MSSGVARVFPGGRVAHQEDQNEEENEENLRKTYRTIRKVRKDWGNVLILPTQEWEAGYGPVHEIFSLDPIIHSVEYENL